MPEILLTLAAVSAGLFTGLYGSFVFVFMPSLGKSSDQEFVDVMRRVNQVILNPVFYTVFWGSVLWPAVALFFVENKILTAVALACGVISHGITVGRNVPLNEQLDAAPTAGPEEYAAARTAFERPWNRLHAIRTTFNLAGTVLLVVACFAE